ncbi:unnamed protein product, partial [Citrullus colocynthis]
GTTLKSMSRTRQSAALRAIVPSSISHGVTCNVQARSITWNTVLLCPPWFCITIMIPLAHCGNLVIEMQHHLWFFR